ncbi:MAG: AtpZ/AtpI family protein [Chitinophagales bacterium]
MSLNKPTKKPLKQRNTVKDYLQYSGMAFEMFAIIGVFAAAGYFLDKRLQIKFPIFLLAFSMIGLFGALYRIVKSLNKK